MTEVIGLCKSVTRTLMIIVDDEGDEIEMYHNGIEESPKYSQEKKDKFYEYFKSFEGQYISYFYDLNTIKIQETSPDTVRKARAYDLLVQLNSTK